MGKIEENYEENKTKNEKFRVSCIKCNGKTSHKVLQSLDYSCHEWIDETFSLDWFDDYQFQGS